MGNKFNPLGIKIEGEKKLGRPKSTTSEGGDGRKQSLYLPESMVKEAHEIAGKLGKSLSWIFQMSFRNSKEYFESLISNSKQRELESYLPEDSSKEE